MKIKILLLPTLLFVCTLLQGQDAIKVEPYIAYQKFANFGDLANTSPIIDAVSPNGFGYTIGADLFYKKNIGLRFERSNLTFESDDEFDTFLRLKQEGILPEIEASNGVATGRGGNFKNEYKFAFSSNSLSAIYNFNLKKFRIGIAAGYGTLKPRQVNNTGPKTDENGLSMYYAYSGTRNIPTDHERFYLYEQSVQYQDGNYMKADLDLSFNFFKGAFVFTSMNYRNGHFKYQIDKEEITATSSWQNTDIEKLKFQNLGFSVGLRYSFGLDLHNTGR